MVKYDNLEEVNERSRSNLHTSSKYTHSRDGSQASSSDDDESSSSSDNDLDLDSFMNSDEGSQAPSED